MTDCLPESWVRAQIADLCLPVAQSGPDKTRAVFRYIDLGALDKATKQIVAADELAVTAAPSRAKQVVRRGDVIFSNVRVYLENIALVPRELDGEIASTAFCVLRPAPGVDPRFLYYFVASRPFVLSVNQLQRGNSPPSVQDRDVRSQTIPLAPENEQKRIASRIDELFSRIDEGERALERVQKLVERYRQSVLKAAVTGELTREWREKHKARPQSGEALLQHILDDRRQRWEKGERERMKAKGSKPANDKWKQKYQAPPALDDSALPALPEGWCWCTGAQLFEWSSGDFLPAKSMRAGDIPVYGGNGVNGQHDEWNVGRRTVVIGRVGVHCGNVHICAERSWITDNAIYAVSLPSGASLDFLALCLRAANLGQQSQGGAQPFVNQKALNEVCIPLPPLDEQLQIVDRLVVETTRLDAVVATAEAELHMSRALKESILKDAFAGALVPQDRSDEPAAELLDRIVAASKSASSPRGRKTKPKHAA